MILIGMFDSCFVRRVAVSMHLLEIPFEHRGWSVGKDFDLIREFNPLGRVPTLVLDDGEALIESASILDYLDDLVGPARALLPPAGRDRREALRAISIALGAAEKGVLQIYETVFRPEEKRHAPWVDRCRVQMHGALAELERGATGRPGWLVGEHMTQADITTSCVFTFLCDALGVGIAGAYPGLTGLTGRCERLPEFRAAKLAFAAPRSPN
jgi:glutathione S-transferase